MYTLALALQLRKKHGKTSVRVKKTSVRVEKPIRIWSEHVASHHI